MLCEYVFPIDGLGRFSQLFFSAFPDTLRIHDEATIFSLEDQSVFMKQANRFAQASS